MKIVNDYKVTVGVGLAGAVAHRTGSDSFTGVLTPRDDGTWRGTLAGRIAGPVNTFREPEGPRRDVGALLLPLVDQTCQVDYGGGQALTVVGRLQRSSPIDPTLDELLEGSFGGEDLILKFYPASSPYGNDGVCAGETFHPAVGPPYVGPGPDETPIRGVYAAWNDLRFTSPIGYTIHLPTGGTLAYTDMHSNFPPDAASRFYVTVTRMEAP